MRKNKLPLILAGILLLLSAGFSQILEKDVSQVLVLGLSGLMFIILSRSKYGRKQMACEINMFKKNPLKALGIFLGVVVAFGGVGFLFGKLLYHMIH